MQREANFPREPQDFLEPVDREVNHSWRIKVVEHFITDVLQGPKCCFLREIMNMGIQVASLEDAISPQNGLYAEIEWNMEDLIGASRPNVSQETEIVFYVFDYVQHQHEIKEFIFLSAYVCEFKMKPFHV